MKTPQRNFVVEFKSRRRKSKAQTDSIWGDTDLRSLVREVDDQSSHLFNLHETVGTPVKRGAMTPDRTSSVSVSEPAGDAAVTRVAIASLDREEVEVSKHEVEPAAQVQESQTASHPRRSPRGAPRKLAQRSAAQATGLIVVGSTEDRSAQSTMAEDPGSSDEVAALDAENKRLKSLLAERLHAQNFQLRKMLERFYFP